MKFETLEIFEPSDLKGKSVLQEKFTRERKPREKSATSKSRIASGGYHYDPAEIASWSSEPALRRIYHKNGALNPHPVGRNAQDGHERDTGYPSSRVVQS